jgi:hypothetical protein
MSDARKKGVREREREREPKKSKRERELEEKLEEVEKEKKRTEEEEEKRMRKRELSLERARMRRDAEMDFQRSLQAQAESMERCGVVPGQMQDDAHRGAQNVSLGAVRFSQNLNTPPPQNQYGSVGPPQGATGTPPPPPAENVTPEAARLKRLTDQVEVIREAMEGDMLKNFSDAQITGIGPVMDWLELCDRDSLVLLHGKLAVRTGTNVVRLPRMNRNQLVSQSARFALEIVDGKGAVAMAKAAGRVATRTRLPPLARGNAAPGQN